MSCDTLVSGRYLPKVWRVMWSTRWRS